jgi:hypothetical protein
MANKRLDKRSARKANNRLRKLGDIQVGTRVYYYGGVCWQHGTVRKVETVTVDNRHMFPASFALGEPVYVVYGEFRGTNSYNVSVWDIERVAGFGTLPG